MFWEFFDLVHDPHEMNNLYADPAHREAVAGMKQRLYALAGQYRDTDVVKLLETLMQNEK